MRVRDSLYEEVRPDEYTEHFNSLIEAAAFVRLPVVFACDGAYGSGKTRLLRGLAANAVSKNYPVTFLNTTDYDAEKVDLARVLVVKMGTTYLREFPARELRASFIGSIAGTVDTALKFMEIDGGIIAAREAIKTAIAEEQKELLGEWTEYGDPVEALKGEFSRMVTEVCESRKKEAKTDVPWLVLIDDLDRLFPRAGLELLMSLRSLMGGAFLADGAEMKDAPPPVLFVFAANLDCLRLAIRQKFSEELNPNKDLTSDFVEHYLGKLFLFGPKVPSICSDSLRSAFRLSPGLEDVFAPCRDQIITLALPSASQSPIPYRTVLRAMDRVQLYFQLNRCQSLEAQSRPALALALFVLEMWRHYSSADIGSAHRSCPAGTNFRTFLPTFLEKDPTIYRPKELLEFLGRVRSLTDSKAPSATIWFRALSLVSSDLWTNG